MSIKIDNLTYLINNKTIINDITFDINKGEILTIIGPNGAGKSTIIKLISGDIIATTGQIKYNNEDLSKINIKRRASIRSVMSASKDVIFNYKVRDIIEMAWIQPFKKENFDFISSLKKISIECNIESLIDRNYLSLSSGEKKRVHLARALIQLYGNIEKSKFLILDEPTENLDLFHEKEIMNLITNKKNEGYGIIIVLHNINLAYQFSDRILLLKNGKTIECNRTKKVMTNTNLVNIYQVPIFVQEDSINIKYNNT